MGCLALDTISTDALRRRRGGQWGQGQRGPRMGQMGGIPAPNPAWGALRRPPPTLLRRPQPPLSSPPAASLRLLGCLLGGPGPNTGFEFPPGRSLGEAKPTPPCKTAMWEEAEGPAGGTICPGCSATCAHCEDMPPGFSLKRPAPHSSSSAQGSQGNSCPPFADSLRDGTAGPAVMGSPVCGPEVFL